MLIGDVVRYAPLHSMCARVRIKYDTAYILKSLQLHSFRGDGSVFRPCLDYPPVNAVVSLPHVDIIVGLVGLPNP